MKSTNSNIIESESYKKYEARKAKYFWGFVVSWIITSIFFCYGFGKEGLLDKDLAANYALVSLTIYWLTYSFMDLLFWTEWI